MATMKAHGAPWQAVPLLLLQILVCSLHPSAPGALTFTSSNHTAVTLPVRCLLDQASALLRLKMSFATTNYSAVAFRSWKPGTDCCGWDGIRCGESGAGSNHVTSLDLGGRGLESKAIDPVLFDLTSLEYLNLAYNDFNGSQLPSTGFERLTKLTYLNLSTSSFSGPVPTASIANLTNLASIDLSTDCQVVDLYSDGYLLFVHRSSPSVRLTEKSLENLIHNLSNLRELHLGFVDLSSSSGTGWCDALVVSCPQLQVLSLPHCRLSGPICGSLSGLRSLSVINLDYNHLSGPFPHSFTSLTNLSVLQLRYNDLQGWIPPAIFQHKKLVTIDVYANLEVSGYLPDFSRGSSLENLNVGRTKFSGIIPGSISNLISLRKLGLGASGFSGELPTSIGNFKSLSELEISGMGVVGPMPSWVANLTSLTSLRFYECGLSGSIPSSLGDLRYLIELVLCDCGFSGEIPSHISNLTQLQVLLLYSNNFVGTVELTFLTNMPDLFALDLSENNLVVLDGEYNSSLASFPKLFHLDLGRCNLSKFPGFLRHQDEIDTLILSHNEIHGAIPYWAWETWTNLYSFELSNNKFTSIGYSSPFLPLQVEIFDLSNNMFEGCIPIPQGSETVLDYSNNMFSSVPSEFSSHLSDVSLFMASGNNFSGEIPLSFCDGLSIQLLDLSYNGFNGSVPSCLMENVDGLESLYFKENKLNGVFPDNIKKGCSFVAYWH